MDEISTNEVNRAGLFDSLLLFHLIVLNPQGTWPRQGQKQRFFRHTGDEFLINCHMKQIKIRNHLVIQWSGVSTDDTIVSRGFVYPLLTLDICRWTPLPVRLIMKSSSRSCQTFYTLYSSIFHHVTRNDLRWGGSDMGTCHPAAIRAVAYLEELNTSTDRVKLSLDNRLVWVFPGRKFDRSFYRRGLLDLALARSGSGRTPNLFHDKYREALQSWSGVIRLPQRVQHGDTCHSADICYTSRWCALAMFTTSAMKSRMCCPLSMERQECYSTLVAMGSSSDCGLDLSGCTKYFLATRAHTLHTPNQGRSIGVKKNSSRFLEYDSWWHESTWRFPKPALVIL